MCAMLEERPQHAKSLINLLPKAKRQARGKWKIWKLSLLQFLSEDSAVREMALSFINYWLIFSAKEQGLRTSSVDSSVKSGVLIVVSSVIVVIKIVLQWCLTAVMSDCSDVLLQYWQSYCNANSLTVVVTVLLQWWQSYCSCKSLTAVVTFLLQW